MNLFVPPSDWAVLSFTYVELHDVREQAAEQNADMFEKMLLDNLRSDFQDGILDPKETFYAIRGIALQARNLLATDAKKIILLTISLLDELAAPPRQLFSAQAYLTLLIDLQFELLRLSCLTIAEQAAVWLMVAKAAKKLDQSEYTGYVEEALRLNALRGEHASASLREEALLLLR